MTPRERVLACLDRETPDVVPMRDAPLSWAIQRWEKEGMRPGGWPADFFENCIDGTGFDETLQIETEILKDDGRTRVVRNSNGVTEQILPGQNATSHQLEWTVKNRTDWERLKTRLSPDLNRVSRETRNWLGEIGRKKETWLCITLNGAFGQGCGLMGMAQTLEMLVLDPEWMIDIADTYADFHIGMLELFRKEGIPLDGAYYNEDIAFKNGPLFSPIVFERIFLPSMRRLFEYMHRNRGHIFFHSDGLITELIPGLIDAGVDILDPLEVKAGVDLAALKIRFGRKLVWEGNIDARILYYGTKEEIESEVKRKISLFPEGGYIYRLDGPITDEASLDNYQWLIECVKRYGTYRR
ncbi:MAG: uroporphyrinogen decarboxylase family protein [Candidatus Omnitrophota bacterium]